MQFMKSTVSSCAPEERRRGSDAPRLPGAALGAVYSRFRELGHADNLDTRYEATLSVWIRWFLLAGGLIEASYRIEYGTLSHILNSLYIVAAMSVNAYVHYRLRSRRRVSMVWLLVLSAMDVAMVSFSVSLSGGFDSRYFVLYYPAAAMFAWVFTSPMLGLSWATLAAAVYVTVCLVAGDGLDLGQHEEKVLFYRLLALYGVVGFVSVLTRFERIRRLEASERELELRQERIQISHTIHDTVAQSLYLLGLGVETAKDMAKDMARENGSELAERLDAIYGRARMAMWELRHPIDSAQVFEQSELVEALYTHASSFTAITDLESEVVQSGNEPELSPLTKGLLFSIAHNAMTNVLLHAKARRVEVALEFEVDYVSLSVSDDGIGMPGDGERRGHGLSNMAANARRMGGHLEITPGIGSAGTTVTCVIPYNPDRGGFQSVRQ